MKKKRCVLHTCLIAKHFLLFAIFLFFLAYFQSFRGDKNNSEQPPSQGYRRGHSCE